MCACTDTLTGTGSLQASGDASLKVTTHIPGATLFVDNITISSLEGGQVQTFNNCVVSGVSLQADATFTAIMKIYQNGAQPAAGRQPVQPFRHNNP